MAGIPIGGDPEDFVALRHLSRQLVVSPRGDVLREVFYSAAGNPATEIFRSEFREVKSKSGLKSIFPHRIEIAAYSETAGGGFKKTILTFNRLELLPEIRDSEFDLLISKKTSMTP